MNKNFQKLIDLYKQIGFRKLLKKLLYHMVAKIYVKNENLIILKNLNDENEISKENSFQIQPITEYHVSMIKEFNARYRNKKNILASNDYFKNKYHGFVAYLNNKMIGYWWWVDNTIDQTITHPCIDRFGISLKEGDAYGFDYYIVPHYRGQGNATKFLNMVHYQLKKRGYNRIWGYVDAMNLPARWLYSINGYKVIKRIMSYEFFSLFLLQGEKVLIRNTKWNANHSFDHRLLFSLKSKEDSTDSMKA